MRTSMLTKATQIRYIVAGLCGITLQVAQRRIEAVIRGNRAVENGSTWEEAAEELGYDGRGFDLRRLCCSKIGRLILKRNAK